MSFRRVSLAKYPANKIQCVTERREARDLVNILAVFRCRPDLEGLARRALADQNVELPCHPVAVRKKYPLTTESFRWISRRE